MRSFDLSYLYTLFILYLFFSNIIILKPSLLHINDMVNIDKFDKIEYKV